MEQNVFSIFAVPTGILRYVKKVQGEEVLWLNNAETLVQKKNSILLELPEILWVVSDIFPNYLPICTK